MNREGECERLGGVKKGYSSLLCGHVDVQIKEKKKKPNLYCLHSCCIKEAKASDHNYLGDFLIVKPPESLAIEERFIVEWEYTLFSLVPTKEGRNCTVKAKPGVKNI